MDIQLHLSHLIQILKSGTSAEVAGAQRAIESVWRLKLPEAQRIKACRLFIEEIKNFEDIQDIDHQVYVIHALKWPFVFFGQQQFEVFFDFILKYIQHPSGKIRQAILLSTDWLLISLRVFSFSSPGRPVKKSKDEALRNTYFEFVEKVENILRVHDDPKFDRYEYIQDMSPSIFKSTQYLLQLLLRNPEQRALYDKFLHTRSSPKSHSFSLVEHAEKLVAHDQILQIQKLLEQELEELIKNIRIDFSVQAIKQEIFNSHSPEKLIDLIGVICKGTSENEFDRIFHLMNDAWNFFPHKSLNGLSPADKLIEAELLKKKGKT